MYYGTNAFIMRLGISFQSIIMGFTLKLTKYDANLQVDAQPASVLLGIRGMVTVLPVIAIILAVILISFYSGNRKQTEIASELKA